MFRTETLEIQRREINVKSASQCKEFYDFSNLLIGRFLFSTSLVFAIALTQHLFESELYLLLLWFRLRLHKLFVRDDKGNRTNKSINRIHLLVCELKWIEWFCKNRFQVSNFFIPSVECQWVSYLNKICNCSHVCGSLWKPQPLKFYWNLFFEIYLYLPMVFHYLSSYCRPLNDYLYESHYYQNDFKDWSGNRHLPNFFQNI